MSHITSVNVRKGRFNLLNLQEEEICVTLHVDTGRNVDIFLPVKDAEHLLAWRDAPLAEMLCEVMSVYKSVYGCLPDSVLGDS